MLTFNGNSQEPVHGNDQSYVLPGQSHRCQYDHHGNQTSLRDACCSDAGSSCRDTVMAGVGGGGGVWWWGGYEEKQNNQQTGCSQNMLNSFQMHVMLEGKSAKRMSVVKDLIIIISNKFFSLISGPGHAEVRLPDGENLAKVKLHAIDLSNIDGCHGLVEGGAVHVDGGAHGQDEPRHSFIHTDVLLQAAEGDGEGGRAAGRRDGIRNSVVWFIMSENG